MGDEDLDNTKKTIEENEVKINRKLATIKLDQDSVIRVSKIECCQTYTDFLLTPNSMANEEKIIALFPNTHRYSVWNDTITVNLAEEDPVNYKHLGEYFPASRKTVVLRVEAFKKLKRPIVLTILKHSILLCFIALCIFGIYIEIMK
jgi:hypothetical protein